ncbi:matrix-remodeling-associated 8-like protein [Labeo rohita]|uniref:Matrix-remodeling-associated 8-like protein n=1 Tax=Labeo rohita TaxID=84645 RepID=A0A498MPT3_LABRO|nr:matrix-remodeling-associated 8-like protein [Labeo rohita]
MDSIAEWTQINETIVYILKIEVNGQINVWNNRHNRINAFREAAAYGNFSILIGDVQLCDLGLYRCQLFRNYNCSLGYKEIQLTIKVNGQINFWNHRKRINGFREAAASGNFSILIRNVQLSDLGLYRCQLFRDFNCSLGYKEIQLRQNVEETDEITYASVVVKSRNCHDNKDPINGSASASASVLQNPETVIYASVKQRDKR